VEEASIYLPTSVTVEAVPLRRYHTAPHLVGHLGEVTVNERTRAKAQGLSYPLGAWVGKSGLEKMLEEDLRSGDGYRYAVVTATGWEPDNPTILRTLNLPESVPPRPGNTAILALDLSLQEVAEAALGEHTGAIVALDPMTGDLLAMVSHPTYDPDRFAAGMSREAWAAVRTDPENPLENRALRGQYPPGSIFKIVTAAAGLTYGVITPTTTVRCRGSYRLGRRSYRCWRRSGHGRMNVVDALTQSCDVFFYQVGQRLGIDRLGDMARRFGLGARTGVSLENELPGLIPTPRWKQRRFGEPWVGGETLQVAIGQSYALVTPLQAAVMMSTIANGGTVVVPRPVLRVVDSATGDTVRRTFAYDPLATNIISPDVHAIIVEGLVGVVNSPRGTAYRRARLEDVVVAGKSGTAQVVAMKRDGHKRDTPVPL